MEEVNKITIIRCRAVIIHDDKLLVVKHSVKNNHYALPGGHLDWGEDVKTCLKREIIEELGIEPKIGRLLYIRNYIDKNNKQSIELYFEVTNSADYADISKFNGTHSYELVEICWLGKNDTKILLPQEIQIDLNKGEILSDTVRFS
jgi:ADP-ribose pyrophosphatase YjhB (NUDIX family)